MKYKCPNCLQGRLTPFYESHNIPVHSVLLFTTRQEARDYPKGDLTLAMCNLCGFSSNVRFKSELHEYSQRYEETQSFSATFRAFHERLAKSLIDKYDLRGKRILEIGCGKGEFLTLLCEQGENQGLGVDPSYVEGRLKIPDGTDIRFIRDFYSEKYSDLAADFVCCKMTLEHIPDPARFVATVRRTLDKQKEALVFFQIPNAERIWRDGAFWDVYYEHCSYFTAQSLVSLFQANCFDVLGISREYDNQYLAVTARPSSQAPKGEGAKSEVEEMATLTASFAERARRVVRTLESKVAATSSGGGRTVIWGGGSKAVAFLSALQGGGGIEYVVDINPHRQGTFLAGGGQEIVGPDFLVNYKPELVILMNSIYRDEVTDSLTSRGLSPILEAL